MTDFLGHLRFLTDLELIPVCEGMKKYKKKENALMSIYHWGFISCKIQYNRRATVHF